MQFRHIFRRANLCWADPYPAKNESEAAPNSNMAAVEEDRIQRLVRELVSSEIREAAPGSSIQQDSSNNSALPPVNVVGTFQNVNEELSSWFNFPRSRSAAVTVAFPANSHASWEIASSFNLAANYGGRIRQRRLRRPRTLPYARDSRGLPRGKSDKRHGNASVNSSCAHPPPGNCGAFACLVSPGGGALANLARPGGSGICLPPGFWHAHVVSDSKSKHGGFYRKGPAVRRRLDRLPRTGKTCGGFLDFMHFFIAHQGTTIT